MKLFNTVTFFPSTEFFDKKIPEFEKLEHKNYIKYFIVKVINKAQNCCQQTSQLELSI
jgi:hypothetical protein